MDEEVVMEPNQNQMDNQELQQKKIEISMQMKRSEEMIQGMERSQLYELKTLPAPP